MNFIGKLLLWGGFLAGSLTTVFDVENKDNPWSTINWAYYAVAVVTGFVGVVLIQLSNARSKETSDKSATSLKNISQSLDQLIVATGRLNEQIARMSPRQMLEFIENELADDFRIFADGRDSITAEYGLSVFAEVMTQFAAGERAINRAWCAAADRYVDEAASCVERAVGFLHEAKRELDAAAS